MTEKTKPCKFKCVLKGTLTFLKWAFVLILAILLIAGLYFQAPPKVLTLIATILAAITILPKKHRKYFWLTAIFALIALTVWVFLPEDNTGWKQYTCQKEIEALNEKYKIQDDQNAAIEYNKILCDYEEDDLTFDFKSYDYEIDSKFAQLLEESELAVDFKRIEVEDMMMSKPWKSEEHPELAAWLAKHEETIKILSSATSYENCFFSFQQGPDIMLDVLPRASKFRSCTKLLRLAIQNDIAEGRRAAALDKFRVMIGMANHMYQPSSLIEVLVSISIDTQVYNLLRELAMDSDLTDSDIKTIEDILSARKYDWQKVWPIILDIEKMLYYKFLYGEYEINRQGEFRYSRNRYSDLSPEMLELLGVNETPDYWEMKLNKLSVFLTWFYLPTDPADAAQGLDRIYKKYYDMIEEDWRSGPEEFSFKSVKLNYPHVLELYRYITDPAMYRMHAMHSRIISDNKVTRIVIELKRYYDKTGDWPDKLELLDVSPDLLVDYVNNGSFVYKKIGDDFTIYSIGTNLTDNGGHGNRISYHGKGADINDDYCFWSPKSRIENEKKSKKISAGVLMPGMPGMPGMPEMPGMPGMSDLGQ